MAIFIIRYRQFRISEIYMVLMPGYWATLKNSSITQQERREASLDYVKQLEHEGITDAFYSEFSDCIKINDLLARIPPPKKQNDLFGNESE